MRFAVIGTDAQWDELVNSSLPNEWLRFTGQDELPDAAAYFSLNGEPVPTNRPVFIHSLLPEQVWPENYIRINAWNGFLQRKVWELSGTHTPECESCLIATGRNAVWCNNRILPAAVVIAMIINEAYFAVEDGVSSRDEIDTAMKLGTNYPYGPFEWARRISVSAIFQLLEQLSKQSARYQPARLLAEEAGLQA